MFGRKELEIDKIIMSITVSIDYHTSNNILDGTVSKPYSLSIWSYIYMNAYSGVTSTIVSWPYNATTLGRPKTVVKMAKCDLKYLVSLNQSTWASSWKARVLIYYMQWCAMAQDTLWAIIAHCPLSSKWGYSGYTER